MGGLGLFIIFQMCVDVLWICGYMPKAVKYIYMYAYVNVYAHVNVEELTPWSPA